MEEWLRDMGLLTWLEPHRIKLGLQAFALLIVGWVLGKTLSVGLRRLLLRTQRAQTAMVVSRMVFYLVVFVAVSGALSVLGLQLGVLLGAAGVLTVALGFASQTSASNLISGLFLLAEQPFVVGDLIRVGEVTGEVLSVDLLSVKIRTFDNLYVRVPNEEVIKTHITNLTHFPIRRVDVHLSVAYKEDLERVRRLLIAVADREPLCLVEPGPLFLMQGFGESGIELQFSVWGRRESYIDLRNAIHQHIKEAFDREGVEIPFPHRTLYAGAETRPIPVRVERS
jgi:small-conductance mechanosensitive channel